MPWLVGMVVRSLAANEASLQGNLTHSNSQTGSGFNLTDQNIFTYPLTLDPQVEC